MQEIKLIIGLGNIGDVYANTRHNVGWWLVNNLLDKFYAQSPWQKQSKLHGELAKINCDNSLAFLLKPHTYMNNSGISTLATCNFYKITANQILVVHDDLDLLAGSIKLKFAGSSGGHNGLKSIDSHLSNKYWRLRIGIGHPRNSLLVNIQNQSVADYVLNVPSKPDIKLISQAINNSIENFDLIIHGNMEKAMMKLHNKI